MHRLFSPLRLLCLVLMLSLTPGCSNPITSLLTGGGPNLAANVQAGKTNTQTIGASEVNSNQLIIRPQARPENVTQDNSNTVNNELPTWMWILGIILFIVGWVTDTPGTILRNLFSARRSKDGSKDKETT